MAEPTVQVPVSLIERLAWAADGFDVRHQDAARDARALLSQPSPNVEPSIEDMEPGTTFTEVTEWTVRRDTGGYLYAHRNVDHAPDRYLRDFDPSTIRDVTLPQGGHGS